MGQLRNLGKVKGEDGASATITFVQPTTLPPGSQATVDNIGSNVAAVLRLGLPQGPQGAVGASIRGEKGDKGEPGVPGRDGTSPKINIHGTTLVDAEEDIRVENRGTSQDVELEFFLKRPPEEITIDEELIENSTNPVQSKAIQEALAEKADSSSIPTKLSELTNDQNYVSEPSVNVMIEDAVAAAASTANPVDDALSSTSVNAVQNKVINSALADKVEMEITEAVDNNNVQYGEMVTLRNSEREVSMVLTGDNIESVVLSQNFAERIPTIVSELPTEGSLDRLYLVPASGNNYSMHIWMDVDGVEKWVNIAGDSNSGSSGSYSGDVAFGWDESKNSIYVRDGEDYQYVELTGVGVEAKDDFKNIMLMNTDTLSDGKSVNEVVSNVPSCSSWGVHITSYNGVLLGVRFSIKSLSNARPIGSGVMSVGVIDLGYFGITRTASYSGGIGITRMIDFRSALINKASIYTGNANATAYFSVNAYNAMSVMLYPGDNVSISAGSNIELIY